ncbi:MAG TPA: PQQ-binding-like beta-propeller repeat protein [Polyangiaceae bacterium]
MLKRDPDCRHWRFARLGVAAAALHAPAACSRPELRVASSSEAPPVQAPLSTALEARTDGRLTTEDRLGGVLWRFRAGAPMLGAPGIDPKSGRVYVGTAEGALHALAADGSFLWSYSLTGPLIGAPLADARGNVYVATSARKLYGMRPTGRLLWNARCPTAPASGLVTGPADGLSLLGADGAIYGVSRLGGVLWRVPLAGGASFGPVALGQGRVLAGSRAGELRIIEGAVRSARLQLQGEIRAAVVASQHVYAVVGSDLVAVELDGTRRWSAPGFERVAAAPDGVVASNEGGELLWFSAAGERRSRAALPAAASAAFAVGPSANVYVPTEAGSVLVYGASGTLEREVAVARAALGDVVLDAPRSRLLVGSGDGTVAALSLTLREGAP